MQDVIQFSFEDTEGCWEDDAQRLPVPIPIQSNIADGFFMTASIVKWNGSIKKRHQDIQEVGQQE